MKDSLRVLGTGREFWGLSDYFSCADYVTLTFTMDSIEHTCKETINLHDDEDGYYRSIHILKVADDDTSSIEILRMRYPDIKIFVFNVNAHEALLVANEGVALVACSKDELANVYIPKMKKTKCGGMSLFMGYDERSIKQFAGQLENFDVKSCVYDMTVHKPMYSSSHQVAFLYVEKCPRIIFPPQSDQMRRFLKRTFSSSIRVYYARTEKEYEEVSIPVYYIRTVPRMIMFLMTIDYFNSHPSNVHSFSSVPEKEYQKLKQSTMAHYKSMVESWLRTQCENNEQLVALKNYYSGVAGHQIDKMRSYRDDVENHIDLIYVSLLMETIEKTYPEDVILREIAASIKR